MNVRYDTATLAAMAFTRLAEGEDTHAVALVGELGYEQAARAVASAARGGPAPAGYERPMARWAHRYDRDAFAADLAAKESEGLGFLHWDSAEWPADLELLGSSRPLALWHKGPIELLAAPAVSIVGSRDCTDYGRAVARDFAYELAARGYLVLSGGAVGIDAAAHEGALAAMGDTGNGATGVVFANGLSRPYPRANTSLFARIAHAGGLFLSEAAPDASPHRHRFLSRNRIIAALGAATVVVEAPYRSGALSTAHHALAIGREVLAVPGPITAPHSAGCHRLLREGGICVSRFEDILELLPAHPAPSGRAGQQELPISGGLSLDDPLAGHPLAVRVREGLAPRALRSAGEVAREAGVSVREAICALGMLESAGVAEHKDGLWRLARRPAA